MADKVEDQETVEGFHSLIEAIGVALKEEDQPPAAGLAALVRCAATVAIMEGISQRAFLRYVEKDYRRVMADQHSKMAQA